MYVNICANKTEKSIDFIEYLDKENSLSSDFAQYLTKESDKFFTTHNARVGKEDVINAIDNNCKHLSKDESRFYSMTINPSKNEIGHIRLIAMQTVDNMLMVDTDGLLQNTPRYELEDKIIKSLLEQYTVNCLDSYALNFNRGGIRTNADLVWFGKVEKDRYYKAANNKQVQHNELTIQKIEKIIQKPQTGKKVLELQKYLIRESDIVPDGRPDYIRDMMPKQGENYHIHVIISRNDKTQTKRLSPLATARENHLHNINGKQCTIGFDRVAYTNKVEKIFDTDFSYNRSYKESFNYFNERKKEIKNAISIHNEIDLSNVNLDDYIPKFNTLLANDIAEFTEKNDFSKVQIYYLDNLPLLDEFYSATTNQDKEIISYLLKCDKIIKSDPKLSEFISFTQTKNQLTVNDRYKYLNWNKIQQNNINIKTIKTAFKNATIITKDDISEFEMANYVKLSLSEKRTILSIPINEIYSLYGSWNISEYVNDEISTAKNERVKEFFQFYSNKLAGKQTIYNPYDKDKIKEWENKLPSKDRDSLKKISAMRSASHPKQIDYYPILLNDLYNSAKLYVTECEVSTDCNRSMFKVQNFTSLSSEDHDIIHKIAQATSRFKDEKAILKSEIYIEKRYYRQGKINVPNINSINQLKLDQNKYICTNIKPLTSADYDIIKAYSLERAVAIYGVENKSCKHKVESYISQIENAYYNSGVLFFSENFAVPKNDARYKVNSYKFLNKTDIDNIKKIAHCKIQIKYENVKIDKKTLCREIEGEVYNIEQQYYTKGIIYIPQHIDLAEIIYDKNKFRQLNKKVIDQFGYNQMKSLTIDRLNGTSLDLDSQINKQYRQYYNDGIEKAALNREYKVTQLSNNDRIILDENVNNYINIRYSDKSELWKKGEREKILVSVYEEYYKYGVVEISNLQYSVKIDSNKFIISQLQPLTNDDYKSLYTIAKTNLSKLYETVPQLQIEKEVSNLERQYNNTGVIYVTAEHNWLVDNEKFKISDYNMLSASQQNLIRELVKIKLDVKSIEIPQIDRERLYNKEFFITSMNYYRNGFINIPKDIRLTGNDVIFRTSSACLLTRGDYGNLTTAATIKVDAQHPQLSVEDREDKISREVSRMEWQYYSDRVIILPNSVEYSAFENENIQIHTGKNLTHDDYGNLTTAAIIKVDAQHPQLSVEDREDKISREVARMEWQYYSDRVIILPNSAEYVKYRNKNIQIYTGRNLTRNDYNNLNIAAHIKIDAMHPALAAEDRDSLITREVARMESQFYNLGSVKTQHTLFGLATHTDVKDLQLTLPLSDRYNNLRNEFKAIYNPLTDKDIDVLKKFVNEKQKMFAITSSTYSDIELSRLQYQYENKGCLYLPYEYGINNKKFVSAYKALQTEHHTVMYRVAAARALEQLNTLPEMKSSDRNTFLQNCIEKEISKLQSQYYENGNVYIPKEDYKKLDRNVFTVEITKFDELRANVYNMALGASRNYIMADLPEYRELYKTYKLGAKGYNVYKLSRNKDKEKLAKALIGRLSKQLVTTTLVKGISYAIPVVGTINFAIDAIKLFRGRESDIERGH